MAKLCNECGCECDCDNEPRFDLRSLKTGETVVLHCERTGRTAVRTALRSKLAITCGPYAVSVDGLVESPTLESGGFTRAYRLKDWAKVDKEKLARVVLGNNNISVGDKVDAEMVLEAISHMLPVRS